MRILSGAAAAARVRKMAARGSRYAEVEPAVRRIIADVRRQGRSRRAQVRGALGWTAPWNASASSEQEIQAAWKSARPELKAIAADRSGQYPPLLRMAKAGGVDAHSRRDLQSDRSYGPWIQWAATFRADATRWSRPC